MPVYYVCPVLSGLCKGQKTSIYTINYKIDAPFKYKTLSFLLPSYDFQIEFLVTGGKIFPLYWGRLLFYCNHQHLELNRKARYKSKSSKLKDVKVIQI